MHNFSNKFQGYDIAQLAEIAESSKHSSDYQLHFLLKKLLERNECKRKDAVVRVEAVIKGKFAEGLYLLFIQIFSQLSINSNESFV